MKKNKFKNKREEKSNSPFENKKKFCPFSQPNSPKIDYKDIRLLSRYITEKGKIISSSALVFVKNLDPSKRPLAAVADNIEVRNIKSLKIKTNKDIKIKLLYDKNRSLVKRIKVEQARRNIN